MSVNAFCKHAGISVSGLLAVLSGKAEPSPATVIKCADAMNCSADYLLGLSDRREYIPARSPAEFKDRIFPLLKTRGITQYCLACDCGLQQSAISNGNTANCRKRKPSSCLQIICTVPRIIFSAEAI